MAKKAKAKKLSDKAVMAVETALDAKPFLKAISRGIKRFIRSPNEKRAMVLLKEVKLLYSTLGFDLYADESKGEKELRNKKEEKRQEKKLREELEASVSKKKGKKGKESKESKESDKPKIKLPGTKSK